METSQMDYSSLYAIHLQPWVSFRTSRFILSSRSSISFLSIASLSTTFMAKSLHVVSSFSIWALRVADWSFSPKLESKCSFSQCAVGGEMLRTAGGQNGSTAGGRVLRSSMTSFGRSGGWSFRLNFHLSLCLLSSAKPWTFYDSTRATLSFVIATPFQNPALSACSWIPPLLPLRLAQGIGLAPSKETCLPSHAAV